ncbi:hypothetical protein Tco_0723141 [Tanacetum coccineum]
MSTHEQQTTNNPTSAVRNTRGRNGPQGLEEPMSDEVRISQKYQENIQKRASPDTRIKKSTKPKLQKPKAFAKFPFITSPGTNLAIFETKGSSKFLFSFFSPHASVFKRLKKNRPPSPRLRPRKEEGVFNRLGSKEPATSARSGSRRRSPQAKRTEVQPGRHQQKGTPSRTTGRYSESEDSEGGH